MIPSNNQPISQMQSLHGDIHSKDKLEPNDLDMKVAIVASDKIPNTTPISQEPLSNLKATELTLPELSLNEPILNELNFDDPFSSTRPELSDDGDKLAINSSESAEFIDDTLNFDTDTITPPELISNWKDYLFDSSTLVTNKDGADTEGADNLVSQTIKPDDLNIFSFTNNRSIDSSEASSNPDNSFIIDSLPIQNTNVTIHIVADATGVDTFTAGTNFITNGKNVTSSDDGHILISEQENGYSLFMVIEKTKNKSEVDNKVRSCIRSNPKLHGKKIEIDIRMLSKTEYALFKKEYAPLLLVQIRQKREPLRHPKVKTSLTSTKNETPAPQPRETKIKSEEFKSTSVSFSFDREDSELNEAIQKRLRHREEVSRQKKDELLEEEAKTIDKIAKIESKKQKGEILNLEIQQKEILSHVRQKKSLSE